MKQSPSEGSLMPPTALSKFHTMCHGEHQPCKVLTLKKMVQDPKNLKNAMDLSGSSTMHIFRVKAQRKSKQRS